MPQTEDEAEHLSPKEMQGWLQAEISHATKALELRTKEATALAAAYTNGEISAAEAAERHWKYSQRWGDPLPGVMSIKGMTDEQILAAIDEAQDPRFVERLLRKHVGTEKKEGTETSR